MKLSASDLRQIIKEELEKASPTGWPAEIPNPASLKALGPKTLQAIVNRSEEKVEGKRKTKVPLGPDLDGTQRWPATVSYPGKTPKSPRVEVTWDSDEQYRAVRAAIIDSAPKAEKKYGTSYSRQVAWEYATGKRF